ncbi:hypothetical protein HaLaN_29039 [Haematococcus lacustris]|uniref:Uncharacterized protein n=1 Tax=Haematococcus lacustris TaxID=44745 RepID=A0A6A0AD82_HAELA|nr:hypothetical protein HaLaN_29039 [Haematococcus lacustris]
MSTKAAVKPCVDPAPWCAHAPACHLPGQFPAAAAGRCAEQPPQPADLVPNQPGPWPQPSWPPAPPHTHPASPGSQGGGSPAQPSASSSPEILAAPPPRPSQQHRPGASQPLPVLPPQQRLLRGKLLLQPPAPPGSNGSSPGEGSQSGAGLPACPAPGAAHPPARAAAAGGAKGGSGPARGASLQAALLGMGEGPRPKAVQLSLQCNGQLGQGSDCPALQGVGVAAGGEAPAPVRGSAGSAAQEGGRAEEVAGVAAARQQAQPPALHAAAHRWAGWAGCGSGPAGGVGAEGQWEGWWVRAGRGAGRSTQHHMSMLSEARPWQWCCCQGRPQLGYGAGRWPMEGGSHGPGLSHHPHEAHAHA